MSRHYFQVANSTLWHASAPEVRWHHGLCTLLLLRGGTDGQQHPPGLSHLAKTETPVMAAGRVNDQQTVGNGGRPTLPPTDQKPLSAAEQRHCRSAAPCANAACQFDSAGW